MNHARKAMSSALRFYRKRRADGSTNTSVTPVGPDPEPDPEPDPYAVEPIDHYENSQKDEMDLDDDKMAPEEKSSSSEEPSSAISSAFSDYYDYFKDSDDEDFDAEDTYRPVLNLMKPLKFMSQVKERLRCFQGCNKLSIIREKLYEGCRDGVTFDDSQKELNNICSEYALTKECEKRLFSLVNSLLPEGTPTFSRDSPQDKASTDNGIFCFECCPKGHCVYAEENADLKRCTDPECRAPRFTDDRERVPCKEMSYKSLCLLLCEYLETEHFMDYLDYHYVNASSDEKQNTTIYHGWFSSRGGCIREYGING